MQFWTVSYAYVRITCSCSHNAILQTIIKSTCIVLKERSPKIDGAYGDGICTCINVNKCCDNNSVYNTYTYTYSIVCAVIINTHHKFFTCTVMLEWLPCKLSVIMNKLSLSFLLDIMWSEGGGIEIQCNALFLIESVVSLYSPINAW